MHWVNPRAPVAPAVGARAALRAPTRMRWASLNAAVIVVCLLVVGGLWTRVSLQNDFERSDAIARAVQRNDNLAVAFEQYVVRTIVNAGAALQVIGREHAQKRSRLDLHRLMEEFGTAGSAFLAVGVLDATGAAVQLTPASAAGDYAGAELMALHSRKTAPEVVIGRPFLAPSSDTMSVTISRRLDKPDGAFAGVAFVAVRPSRFTEFYEEAQLDSGDLLTLVGLDGIIMARRIGNRQSAGNNLQKDAIFTEAAQRPVSDYSAIAAIDGVQRRISYRTLRGFPLIVAAGKAEADILAGSTARRTLTINVAAGATGLIALAALMLLAGIARTRRAHDAVCAGEERREATFHQAAIGIARIGLDGSFLEVNRKFCEITGYATNALLRLRLIDLGPSEEMPDAPTSLGALIESLADSPAAEREQRLVRKDGSIMWTVISAAAVRDRSGATEHYVAMINDVSARKRSEAQLSKVARARRVLAECNRVLVHASDESAMLQAMCATLTGPGGYRLVRVSMAEPGEAQPVRVVAQAGPDAGAVPDAAISLGDDVRGRGTAGRALRTGRACVVGDIDADPDLAPWHERARTHGFKSAASLPLKCDGVPFGVMTLQAPELSAFDAEEVALLEELAGDMAYGILSLRTRVEHARTAACMQESDSVRKRAEDGLRASEQRFADMLANIHLLSVMLDADARITWCNDYLVRLTGWSRDELIGRDWFEKLVPVERRQIQGVYPSLLTNGTSAWHHENQILTRSGERRLVQWNNSVLRDASGNATGSASIGEDVTERRAAEDQVRLHADLLGAVGQAVIATDLAGAITYCNRFAERLYGRTAPEMKGRRLLDVAPIEGSARQSEERAARLRGGESWQDEIVVRRCDGTTFAAQVANSPIYDRNGALVGNIGVSSDITERKAYESQIEYLATHDALTDLPNCTLLNDRLNQAIGHAERTGTGLGVVFLDLDHFKYVNDGYGHSVGDALLKAIAERLRGLTRTGDTVARLGGDEFVVLLTELDQPFADASNAGQRLINSFMTPFVIDSHRFTVTASIGVSLFPADGRDLDVLLNNADAAMYRAKELGRNDYQFYASEMSIKALARVTLEVALRQALALGQLALHYQPLIAMGTGEVTGVEALLRWTHPELGEVTPAAFIPLAEETGLIIPIGEWVLRTACAQNRAWQDAGMPALTVGVNLSALQLRQPGFAGRVAAILGETGLDPRRLNLEITESMVMGRTDSIVGCLDQLRAQGITLSMDDFGTGYSNLGYLMHLPLDILKIDRSFVRDLPTHRGATSIARAIVSMGRSLGLRVVAEGVETPAQAAFLESIWCEQAQGFLYCRPLPASELAAWISARQVPARLALRLPLRAGGVRPDAQQTTPIALPGALARRAARRAAGRRAADKSPQRPRQ